SFVYALGSLRCLTSFPTRRSSDLDAGAGVREAEMLVRLHAELVEHAGHPRAELLQQAITGLQGLLHVLAFGDVDRHPEVTHQHVDRKSTRLNSSHVKISYAVFCLK